MKNSWRLWLAVALTATLTAPTMAVDLIGYYEFEGNFSDSAGTVGAGVASQNPGQVSFVAGGFRGQAVDINDPAASGGGNTGGSVDFPVNVSPQAAGASFSFGGWFNLDSNAGFPGVVANDNGGWDRGIHLNTNNWGITSGAGSPLNGVAPAPTGEWTYVLGTFDDAGSIATLYVGDDLAGTQTTASGSRADNATDNGGLAVLELGRYDNQDLDALVDDFTIWDDALTADQANAIRNLRLNSNLDYSPADAELLFDLFDAGAGTVTVGGVQWSVGAVAGANPGEVFDDGNGNFQLRLDAAGGGLNGIQLLVPEPSTIAIWTLLGFIGLGFGWRKTRRQS